MSVFARIKKRAALAVGDTGLYVRELTFKQVENVQSLESPELKTWLTLAYCIVDAAGERQYVDVKGRTIVELAEAVKEDASDYITAGILGEIMKAMERLSKPVDQDALQKN